MFLPDEDNPAGHEYIVLGLVLVIAGAFFLHCYFDRSGRSKPLLAKLFLPLTGA